MDFDWTIVFAAGLFGHMRHAETVELIPCADCVTWEGRRHVRAVALREYPDTLDFFESYVSGVCPRPAVAA